MYITVRMSNSKKITGRKENLIFFKNEISRVEEGKITINVNHVLYVRPAKDDEIEHAKIHGW